MHPGILPAAFAFATAFALAVVVALRRDKTSLHWQLLVLLSSLMIWTLGTICRFSVQTDAGLGASLRLIFLGVFTGPPLWLLLAGHYAQVRWLTQRRGVIAALFAPALVVYLALLTNSGHHLVVREETFAAMERGGIAWAGPLFWAYLPWAYFLIAVASFFYLRSARQLVRNAERRRGLLLALVALLPVAGSCVYMLQLVPVRFDLTPTTLAISLVVISTTIFRYRLLESLPLTRRDVIEHLPDGVVLADSDGAILDLNSAAARILGVPAASLLRRPLTALLEGFPADEHTAIFGEALVGLSLAALPRSAELVAADDRRIELSAHPVRDANGEPTGQYVLLRDRTDERRFERIARQAQRLQTVGTLAAGIAHEVNNPLAFIRANLGQIQRLGEVVEANREGPDAKLAAELADLPAIAAETLDGIQRIERIVLDMRRLSSAREETFRRIDLNEATRDAIRLANLHRDVNVGIEVSLAEGPLPVEGSTQRLVQALLNVLMNALQAVASRRDGRIRVASRSAGDQAIVEITDNGPGIPRELHERIFDPFFTTKGPDQGTGLGLAIAFDIARDHGGLLDVHSRPGEGASFSLRLPLRAPVAPARAPSAA